MVCRAPADRRDACIVAADADMDTAWRDWVA